MHEILIYGVIGETLFGDGTTARQVAEQLAEIDSSDDIRVRINSPGGLAHEGIAIYNLLAERAERVTVDIDALAASAATVIAMAGSTIRMATNAQFMIHKPFTFVYSHADDMRKMADVLDQIEGSLIATYRTRTTASEDELREMMAEETYLTAAEAKGLGFVDEITGRGSDPEKARAQVRQLANRLQRPEAYELPKIRERVSTLAMKARQLALTKIRTCP